MIQKKLMQEALNTAAFALGLQSKSEFMVSVKSAIEFGATGEDFAKALKITPAQGEELIERMKPFMK